MGDRGCSRVPRSLTVALFTTVILTMAACVSHSLVTAKRSGVKALSMLAHARVAKVPPECVSSSTTLLRKEWLSPWKRKPACNRRQSRLQP